jgi:hypothetical protein
LAAAAINSLPEALLQGIGEVEAAISWPENGQEIFFCPFY